MSFPTYEEVLELKKVDTKNIWVYLSEKHNEDKEKLRRWFRTESDRRNHEAEDILLPSEENPYSSTRSVSTNSESYVFDNVGNIKSISSVKTIEMTEEQKENPEYVLVAHGYNPEKWTIASLVNSYKDSKKDGNLILFTSRITVKPKVEPEVVSLTISDIDKFFSCFDSKNISLIASEKHFSFSNKKLLINLADVHFGNNTNGFSARKSIMKLVDRIVEKSKKFTFSEIILCNLGDLMHIDNYLGQTTSGTQVGERGSYYNIWGDAVETLIYAINTLKTISPVRYVSISGNHDKVSSYTIGKTIAYYFSKDDLVTTDCDFEERKYLEIGNSVFGLVHGDLPSKNVPSVLQREAKEMFGRCKYAYVLLGHIHHIRIVDEDGVIVSHVPSVTPEDDWHKGQAYTGSWKGTFCYVVDEQEGISDTWHIPA